MLTRALQDMEEGEEAKEAAAATWAALKRSTKCGPRRTVRRHAAALHLLQLAVQNMAAWNSKWAGRQAAAGSCWRLGVIGQFAQGSCVC